MLIDHHVQQIVRWETQNLELCFWTNVGTNQAKIEKISISLAILLGFLRSLVSPIRCEGNKINRRREEGPIGSRAVKMLRDLRRRARVPHSMSRRRTRVPKWEHICTTGRYDKPVIYCGFPARALQQLSDRWNFQDNFAFTAGTEPKNFRVTVTLFQLYAKDDFNASLPWCCTDTGASHTAKSLLQNHWVSHCILPQSQWAWLTQRNKMFLSSI